MEHAARAIVHKGFGLCTVREDDVVAFQLNVEISHLIHAFCLKDACAVDQSDCGDQNPVQIHGVEGRNGQVLLWQIIAQRTATEDDWKNVTVPISERARIVPATNPVDGSQTVRTGLNKITDFELFDRNLPAVRQDECAAAIAGRPFGQEKCAACTVRLKGEEISGIVAIEGYRIGVCAVGNFQRGRVGQGCCGAAGPGEFRQIHFCTAGKMDIPGRAACIKCKTASISNADI